MFQFKRFTIKQDCCALKVGTDGVLLGAWAGLDGSEKRILDVGSGSGLISLMMAQRSEAQIDGVEIDKASAEQSRENIADSSWSDRVQIYEGAVQQFIPDYQYDLIVTNPPFFVDSLQSDNCAKMRARHTVDLSFKDLAESAIRLLNHEGRIAMVLPYEESRQFDFEAASVGLYLSRRTFVYSILGGELKRVLSEYQVEPTSHIDQQDLVIQLSKNGDYSPEYRDLTSNFYLKF